MTPRLTLPPERLSVRVGLHRSRGLVSNLIRWQTRSDYSHASVLETPATVIEAMQGDGVRRRAVRDIAEPVDWFDVWVHPTARDGILAFLRAQLGKAYDYTMVARFVTRRQETRGTTGKWFCSELAFAAFLYGGGVTLLARTEPWEASPGLLARSPLLVPVPAHA
jgi:uncharacterized protein YycO